MDDGDHAALAVQRAVGRERNRKHAAEARDLARHERTHGGLIRVGHVQIGKYLVKGQVFLKADAEHVLGRGIHMDQFARSGEGCDAVRHVQKQGGKLVALALHLAHRAFQGLCHVVERAGQLADLIGGLYA